MDSTTQLLRKILLAWRRLGRRFVPVDLRHDPELHRQARLHIGFGILGSVFGTLYAAFYLLIHHFWGAGIILFCSAIFAAIPWILKRFHCLHITGNLFAFTLLLGFTGLCTVEGGMNGHAIAWLAGIPLCVLLLVRLREALFWTLVCFGVALFFGFMDLLGVTFPETFDARWHVIVHMAGYAGLIPFMALLGLIFELTRRQAFDKLHLVLRNLSKANNRLTQLNEEKNEFLGIAAHDLKNPLGVIVGFGSILENPGNLSQEQIKDFAGHIMHSSNRMLDLISNLLDTRAIEEGRVKLKCENCSIERILKDVHHSQDQLAIRKEITLDYDLEPHNVFVDRNATFQVLENLISNAIKYSPPKSIVRISTLLREDGVAVGIKDQGPGLSEEDQAKLFQKFSRLTPKPTAGEGSNGLGLWIVRRLAEAMNGNVWCESALGEGSTFGVTLPRSGEAQEATDGGDIFDLLAA